MNITPVNNNNYKNNQASFGMIIDCSPKAIEVIGEEALSSIRQAMRSVQTNDGKHICAHIKPHSSKDGSVSISAWTLGGNKSAHGIIVSHSLGKDTFNDRTIATFGSALLYTLKKIARVLNKD